MRDWTEREFTTLAALAEAFVAGDGAARARLAADALSEVADPTQVAQIRQALAIMASPIANLALAGRPQGFDAMTSAARERYLLGWAGSRLALRRSAFGAFRKLMTFLAYAAPGPAGTNPRLAAMGYEPDRPPITTDLARVTPLGLPFETGSPDEPMTLDADVVIVGSGAGGGVIAAALAEAGRSVVVLEAGPYVDESTMPTAELDAFDRLYLDHGLLATWDGSVNMLAGTGVGGGTLVNWMTSIDAPASVRAEWASDHGLEGLDRDVWDSDVSAIETEIDVAEATHIPPKDAILMRGARALGWQAGHMRRDASGCGDCGSCPFGCRRGAKQSGIRAHLARATTAGARIVPDAHVTRVLVQGGRAVGVEATARAARRPMDVGTASLVRPLIVRAPTVVVAAGALRSPSVLQASGLGHPAIGRYLRLHPVSVVAGRFSEPIDMWRGTMQGACSLQFAEGEAGRRGYVIETAPGHPGLLALALPWESAAEHAQVMAGVRHVSPLVAVTRDGGEGRTSLTKAGRTRIDYRLDAEGVATLRHALMRMARIARAAGALEIVAVGTPPAWYRPGAGGAVSGDAGFAQYEEHLAGFDFAPNRGTVFSAHQMGTVRMGADRRDHPCDPWGRVRVGTDSDAVIGGLYVGDGSAFPTAIGVNPMITIMALARRTARTILAET